jgi:hypothetical protein
MRRTAAILGGYEIACLIACRRGLLTGNPADI